MKSFVVTAALACSFLATTGDAQPVAQLLQKGIYNQETAGDLDAAIQIYRQLVAAPDRAIAAQAQFRLSESLLAKGDLAAASEEFGKLARDFADSPFTKTMAARARALSEGGIPQLLGAFQSGRYHHNLTGTELTVPSDWSFRGQKAQPNNGDRMDFADSSGQASAFFWVRQLRTPTAQIGEQLRPRLDLLAGLRQHSNEMRGFRLRPESTQTRLIGGRQALFAVGDFAVENGERMTEYWVFIDTEKAIAFFNGRTKTANFAAMQSRFDQIVNSVVIP